MGWLSDIFSKKEVVHPVAIDDSNFEREVLRSPTPVMLDIWTEGCVPCKRLEPVVMDLAKKYRGQLKVAELNPQRGPRTVAKLGVRSTPTVIYFDRGDEIERIIGFRSSLYHSEFIESELLNSE